MQVAPNLTHLSLDEPEGRGQARHIPELDGLRGAAALVVVFYHIAKRLMPYEFGWMHLAMDSCILGFLGVDVFFALSGFLITRILLEKREQKHFYRNFYARRILRLAPPYLLTIAIVAIFAPGNGKSLLLSLVYLANFATLLHIPVGYGVLWSLSVEEHFYFIWPWLVRFVTPRNLFRICIFVCLFTPLGRIYAALHGGLDAYLSWYRFDGLAWGALLALMLSDPKWKSGKWKPRRFGRAALPTMAAGFFLFILGVFCWAKISKDIAGAIFYTAVPVITVGLIAFAIERPRRIMAPFRSRALRFFGDISYWMYLIHIFFIYKFAAFLLKHAPVFFARGGFPLWLAVTLVTFTLSVASGVAVRRWIELPALRMKSRFS